MTAPSNRVQKLPRLPGLPFGISTAYPLLPEHLSKTLKFGISEFVPGVVETDLTYDEALYMLEGQVEIEADGETHVLTAGEAIWMPRGRRLAYRASQPCRLLWIIPSASES